MLSGGKRLGESEEELLFVCFVFFVHEGSIDRSEEVSIAKLV